MTTVPAVQTAYYLFETEDEAHLFCQGVREDLEEQGAFEYVDHNVELVVAGHWMQWRGTVDYREAA